MRQLREERKNRVGTRELRQNLKDWLLRSEDEPVTVTVAGYERHVILSIDEYRRLTQQRAA